jgi:hypothetical protein
VWAAGEEAQAGVWTHKELRFTYMGFTTKYSCEGLRGTVREILLQLGARKDDLKVYDIGCTGRIGAPEPLPTVNIKMSVLQPATGAPSEVPVSAHWKPVDLTAYRPGIDAAGKCELFEQVKQHILPQFTVRNLDASFTCVPHQLTPGGQRLVAQVLVADQPPPAPAP